MAILLWASEDCSLGPIIGRWRCKAYTVEVGYTASAVIQSDFLKDRKEIKLKTELPSRSNMLYVHGNGAF